MPAYLGNSEKVKIMHSGSLIKFNVFTTKPITNGVRLVTSDNYTLKDSKGLYLTVKDGDNNGI
jgi:hypothetical protein